MKGRKRNAGGQKRRKETVREGRAMEEKRKKCKRMERERRERKERKGEGGLE